MSCNHINKYFTKINPSNEAFIEEIVDGILENNVHDEVEDAAA